MTNFSKTLFATACMAFISICMGHEDEWKELSVKIPKAISDQSATYIESKDMIILAGGCDGPKGNEGAGNNDYFCMSVGNKAYGFTPSTGSFSSVADMPVARYRHAAVNIGTKLYLIGGRDVNDALIPQIDVLDTETNDWSQLMNLSSEFLTSDNTAVVHDGMIYVMGGFLDSPDDYTAQKHLFAINVETKAIEKKADMLTARGDAHAVHYTHDKKSSIFIMGGFSHVNKFCKASDDVEEYSFESNSWTAIPDLKSARGDKAAVILNNRILAIGGEDKHESYCGSGDSVASGSRPVNDVEAYDPRKDNAQWEVEVDLPVFRFRGAAAAVESLDSVYLFGGQAPYLDACDCYPTSDEIFLYRESHDHDAGGMTTPTVDMVFYSTMVMLAVNMIA